MIKQIGLALSLLASPALACGKLGCIGGGFGSGGGSGGGAPTLDRVWSDGGMYGNGVVIYDDTAGQPYFTFPAASPGINYLTRPINGIATPGKGISLTFTVAAPVGAVFDWRTNPNNTCNPGTPGTVRLFIDRAGDNGTAQQYRYWSTPGFSSLAPGQYTITATWDPTQWTDVYGAKGSANPVLFAQAIQYMAQVGMTFGGGCFYGHGVFNSGAGPATFTINSFTVQ
jgi:hypothetical protein